MPVHRVNVGLHYNPFTRLRPRHSTGETFRSLQESPCAISLLNETSEQDREEVSSLSNAEQRHQVLMLCCLSELLTGAIAPASLSFLSEACLHWQGTHSNFRGCYFGGRTSTAVMNCSSCRTHSCRRQRHMSAHPELLA